MQTELDGFDAYSLYHALKLHFTGSYDFIKYNGKTNVSKDQFAKRKDRYSFYRLSRKYNREELISFLVSNFVYNPKIWIMDLLLEEAEDRYKKWMKKQQSLSYVFKENLDTLFEECDNPDELLKVQDGEYPKLYNQFLQGNIEVETILILNNLLNFVPMWDKKISDDLIYPEFSNRCKKYAPFIHYERNKMKDILKGKLCLVTA
jgi:hypothetical protein